MSGGARAALVFGVVPVSVVFLLWFAFGWFRVKTKRDRRRRLEGLLARTSANGAVAGGGSGASAASGLASRRADPRSDGAQFADPEARDAEIDVDVDVDIDVVGASEADARDAVGARSGDLTVRRVIGELDVMQKRYDAVIRAVATDGGPARGMSARFSG